MVDRGFGKVSSLSANTVLLAKVRQIIALHAQGLLGGSTMPEDCNPGFDRGSRQNYSFFTLTMSLNYRRNSYALWRSATSTASDLECCSVFDPDAVVTMSRDDLKEKLVRHGLAMQREKQTNSWLALCKTFVDMFDGDVRRLFENTDRDVRSILQFIRVTHKKRFPYLSGEKISNYWLYVMSRYTEKPLVGIEWLSIAPDTHVIQASQKLGVVSDEERGGPDVQLLVNSRWKSLLEGTELAPIELHTPFWLWSRAGCPDPSTVRQETQLPLFDKEQLRQADQ